MIRRTFLQGGAVLAGVGLAPFSFAQANAWKPTRPIRIIVPFAPGGVTDIQARAIAAKMTESLGSPVIVENKPGGSSVIGAREVMRAAPDGHTVLYNIATMVQLPHLYKEPPFDPLKDFTPLTAGAFGGTVLLAHESTPYKTVAELVAFAKANPGKVPFASFGTGSTAHLNIELLKRQTGIDVIHVPYQGSAPAHKDLLGGQVHLLFDGVTTAISNTKTGRVRMLAAATEARIPAIPDLPTMREQGFDVGIDGWLAFFAPPGLPQVIADTLQREISRAVQLPDIKRLIVDGGYAVGGIAQADFTAQVKRNSDQWGKVIREANIKLEQ